MTENKNYVSNNDVQNAFGGDSKIKFLKEKVIVFCVVILLVISGFFWSYKSKNIKKSELVSSKEVISEKAQNIDQVSIGKQIWMTKNLDVSNFLNGDPIPEIKTDLEWEKAIDNGDPAWCYYNYSTNIGNRYGKMYNWYALTDPRGLAPKDWRIPSNEDWSILTDYLGGEKLAGNKMKSLSFWTDYNGQNINGTNDSGFSGLPGGLFNGMFDGIGSGAFWWSNSKEDNSPCKFYIENYESIAEIGVSWGNINTSNGLYVRCLKE
jgi:uncharacterized protein (TIGR02145 family)